MVRMGSARNRRMANTETSANILTTPERTGMGEGAEPFDAVATPEARRLSSIRTRNRRQIRVSTTEMVADNSIFPFIL